MSRLHNYSITILGACLLGILLLPNLVYAGNTNLKSSVSFTVVEGKPTKPTEPTEPTETTETTETPKDVTASSSVQTESISSQRNSHLTSGSKLPSKPGKQSASKWLPQLGEHKFSVALLLILLMMLGVLLQRLKRFVNKK